MGRRCGYTSGIKGSLLANACNCLGDNEEGTGGWLDPTSKCELLIDSEKLEWDSIGSPKHVKYLRAKHVRKSFPIV